MRRMARSVPSSQDSININVSARQPITQKEMRFFGTSSFDEDSVIIKPKCNSPKFLRTQSYGEKLFSPKLTTNKTFFKGRRNAGCESPQRQWSTGSAERLQSRSVCSSRDGSVSRLFDLEESAEWSENDDAFQEVTTEQSRFSRLRRNRLRTRSSSISVDTWDDVIVMEQKSSSATELISRRGVFSRRHYGSVDQLAQTELEGLDPNCRRFRLENGESLAEKDEVFGSPSTPILENPEHQTRWYFKYFLGKLHQNYVGIDSEKNPYFLSVVSQDSGNKTNPLYRTILFRKQGAKKIAIPYNPNQKMTVKQILAHFPTMDNTKTPKELFSADIQKDLLLLEEQEGSVNFKFGVVYMRSGQQCDDEMLSNEYGSEDFQEFLGVLGEKVRLKGWERFRGGLDVKGDMTGKYSIYTLYEGHEIMFHVSTLLPFSHDNRQQVERKRHIGNDIINIVFIDEANNDGLDFAPNWIKSQFTHVFAVVTKLDNMYRLSIYCDETVPPFGPTLPSPPEFKDAAAFREFLLVKLINGEKATFQTPTFSRKRERTLEMLIKDLHEEYVHDTKMTMLNRRAFSEVLYDAPRTSRLKEDARQVEFVRIGQALKLEAIVRGDAPTSLASACPGSVFKRPPWEPQCFYAAFHHRGNLIGDSFGHDALFVATDEGTFFIREDQSICPIFDKTFCIRQMTIIEDHDVMLVRGGSATHKDGHRVHVFRLNEFKEDSVKVRSRLDVKERRLDKTRGCHLFTTSKGGDGHLRMAVSIGRKMMIFQWKHTAAWTSWCQNNDMETIEGFLFLKEITLHDTPSIMTILDGPESTNAGLLICVGFKNHFEIVSEQTGQSTRIHETENSKRSQSQLIAALDLCDGQETELLLCYNHTCHFQKLQEENKTNEFDFHWNTSPSSIVCAFPYIIAFTSDSIEIRLLVNGNLVHVVTMAELQLITSKRDIYFATTAPEFIPKEARIRSSDADQMPCDMTKANNCQNMHSSDMSNERILEIKHKIEKIEAQNHAASSPEDQSPSLLPINTEDNLHKYLHLPSRDEHPCFQRARSLQKPKAYDDNKRLISKSNSCGDSYAGERDLSPGRTEPSVPPNSPKVGGDAAHSPTSRKNSCYRASISGRGNNHGDDGGVEKVKPLRIYRIPLSNLTGAHSHYHAHNTAPKVSMITKKIEEDEESPASAADDGGCGSILSDQLGCDCTKLPLFSST